MQKQVLVFGSNGQLGKAIKSVVDNFDLQFFKFIFLDKHEGDITNTTTLTTVFSSYNPAYVINCAAYTKVDLAEKDKETANKVNGIGSKNLAELCKKNNCILIHISTDFVFKGNTLKLLTETNAVNPINYYGVSKYNGELAIEKELPTYFIIRTSWLYSEFGSNFVKTMLRLAQEKDSLDVVSDQIGTPTYAVDLASFIIQIIQTKSTSYGIYHYSNEGLCSWYDFAKSIFEYANIAVNVSPVLSTAYKTVAKRPKFSVMSKAKTKATFSIRINHWRTSLKQCLEELK